MKWIQYPALLFLLIAPLLQFDQVFDSELQVCDIFLISESGSSDLEKDEYSRFVSDVMFFCSTEAGFTLQSQNPLSIFYCLTQGTSLFQRPPPGFNHFIICLT